MLAVRPLSISEVKPLEGSTAIVDLAFIWLPYGS